MVDKLRQDLKQAQLNGDEIKVSTLRLLLSEIQNNQIKKGPEVQLSDEEIISIIQREIKVRKEAAEGFRKGGREDSALKEEAEQKVLEVYLPAQLSIGELTQIVETSINETGATSMQDMGKVIGAVMGKVKGQADGSVVSSIVKQKLTITSSQT